MFDKLKHFFSSKQEEVEESKMFSQLNVKDPIYNVTVYYDSEKKYKDKFLIENVVFRKGFCGEFEPIDENTVAIKWESKTSYFTIRGEIDALNTFGPIVKKTWQNSVMHLFTVKSMAEACYQSFLLKQEQLKNQLTNAINSQTSDNTALLKAIEDGRKYIMSLVPKD